MTEETFEQRSCLRKRRFDVPEKVPNMKAYACTFCGGWHLATNHERRRGDVTYTEEGWPIVSAAR